jgi:hypothetical protein
VVGRFAFQEREREREIKRGGRRGGEREREGGREREWVGGWEREREGWRERERGSAASPRPEKPLRLCCRFPGKRQQAPKSLAGLAVDSR